MANNSRSIVNDAYKFDELMYQLEHIDMVDGCIESVETAPDEWIIKEALYKWGLFHDSGTLYWEQGHYSDNPDDKKFYRDCIKQAKAFLKKHCPEALGNPNLYWDRIREGA